MLLALLWDKAWPSQGKPEWISTKKRSGRAEAVTQLAVEVFGNRKEAKRWLDAPHKALGGNSPASLCKTEAEAIQVRRVLHAVELGRKRENGVDFLSL
ncbi:MbcA/ParS/Xre antitoxin family protein [Pseudomonas sp. NP21570]|nr:MbcA/ParS/Xre antitoxin family protein [Pseudomonas sp. NP21570]